VLLEKKYDSLVEWVSTAGAISNETGERVAGFDERLKYGPGFNSVDNETSAERDERIPSTHTLAPTFVNSKESLKIEIASAVRFGLESGVFLGYTILEGERLSALYTWLDLLRQSFPGDEERLKLDQLYKKLEEEQNIEGGKISSGSFDRMLKAWDFAFYPEIFKDEDSLNQNTTWQPKWTSCGRSPNSYSCALWHLFHVLTVSSASGGASPTTTLNGILSFVVNFFSCNQCRSDFLESNKDPFHEILEKAESLGFSKDRALTLWFWAEHNAVSRRLLGEKNLENISTFVPFPDPDQCSPCRDTHSGNFNFVQQTNYLRTWKRHSDMEYLARIGRTGPNGIYNEIALNPGFGSGRSTRNKSFETETWDFDAVFLFLRHTYCFKDSQLSCPAILQDGYSEAPPVFYLSRGALHFQVLAVLLLLFMIKFKHRLTSTISKRR
jgi:hypothetical protein